MTAPHKEPENGDTLGAILKDKVKRKARAQQAGRPGVWFGLGMFGLIGWAVAVPTLVGVALGLWLDRVAPTQFSWTLALLLAGVTLGAANAWLWVEKERKKHIDD
jgi:ATP synthase protein I